MLLSARRVVGRSALAVLILVMMSAVGEIPAVKRGPGTPVLICFLTIFAAAWLGGRWPGLALTGLIALGTWPREMSDWRLVRHALFVASGVAISQLVEVLHAARRRAEAESRLRAESEARARSLFEANPRPMWVYDAETLAFLDVNRAAIAQYGYSRDEFLALTIAEIRSPDEGDRLRRHLAGYPGGDQYGGKVWRHRRRDGTEFDVRITSGALDFDGRASRVVLAEDVTAQVEAGRRLRESEARSRRLADSGVLGVIVADLGGRILEANDAFLQLLGFGRDDLEAGRVRWDELTPPEHAARDALALAELDRSGRCSPYEKEFFRRDGTRVPLVVGSAWEDGPGRVVAFVLDISDRKRIEAELVRAREAAEEAGRAKDRFLAVLSHELRTPLTPVLLGVGALLDDPATPGGIRPTLEMMRRNVGFEARLIDDLLDLTRLARGRLSLEPRPVDAHSAVRLASEVCRADFEAAGVALEVDLLAEAPVVEADPMRLQQVVWNLLKNAAKFTPRGGSVAVRSRNRAVDGGPPGWTLDVVDTGIGIPPESLPRIFEAFEQGEAAPNRRADGLGLGLAIGRAVAEAHGGRLTATSPGPGRGSTFTLTLPGARAEGPPAPAPPEAVAPPAGPGPLRILLVEDNPDTRKFLALVLGLRGHDVRAAEDIAGARELAAAGEFDLLLSDIELPDGTGLELMGELAGRFPGLAMSGYGSEDDLRMSRSAGFADHLVKPLDIRRLERAIAAATAAAPPARGGPAPQRSRPG